MCDYGLLAYLDKLLPVIVFMLVRLCCDIFNKSSLTNFCLFHVMRLDAERFCNPRRKRDKDCFKCTYTALCI